MTVRVIRKGYVNKWFVVSSNNQEEILAFSDSLAPLVKKFGTDDVIYGMDFFPKEKGG